MPIVTTLHTVLREPTADQRQVMLDLADLSSRLVVMSEHGRAFLTRIYGVPDQKIDVITHGIPDTPFADANSHKDQFGVDGRHVVLTFGLLSPNKGIEHALHALPQVINEFPDLVYIVLGATHPKLVSEHGESYRRSLERLAADLGIGKHVIFYNRFVEHHELVEFIAAADVYVNPADHEGLPVTILEAMALGRPVVATAVGGVPSVVRSEETGILVEPQQPAELAAAIRGLLDDPSYARELAARGRRLVEEEYGLEPMVRTFEELYVEVLGG